MNKLKPSRVKAGLTVDEWARREGEEMGAKLLTRRRTKRGKGAKKKK